MRACGSGARRPQRQSRAGDPALVRGIGRRGDPIRRLRGMFPDSCADCCRLLTWPGYDSRPQKLAVVASLRCVLKLSIHRPATVACPPLSWLILKVSRSMARAYACSIVATDGRSIVSSIHADDVWRASSWSSMRSLISLLAQRLSCCQLRRVGQRSGPGPARRRLSIVLRRSGRTLLHGRAWSCASLGSVVRAGDVRSAAQSARASSRCATFPN